MKEKALSVALLILLTCQQVLASSSPGCQGENLPTERLFIQQLSDTRVIIKWRGDATNVCLGERPSDLSISYPATIEDGHHIARIQGLKSDTDYFYSIGGAKEAIPGHRFRTAPTTGSSPRDGNVRFWLLGDSGTATEFDRLGNPEHLGKAAAVRDGFLRYNNQVAGDSHIDAILLLGDNAYPAGTDEEWQGAFFDIYPNMMRSSAIIPTIGNHEMGVAPMNICLFMMIPGCDKGKVVYPLGGTSVSSDPNSYDSDGNGPDASGLPYLNIFTLPTLGETGGVASGTEQYYSTDFGNVHIVSLDSQLSNADDDLRAAMRDWLVADLKFSQSQDWKIVIFHHPPYSKGENHDSDLEKKEIDMRQTFAPVFEEHGVDAVYSGHAHNYERSWYLRGHYGSSETFNVNKHATTDHNGSATFGHPETPYKQDNRLVYTVAGSSGKANKWHPCDPDRYINGQAYGCTMNNWLMHPAHRTFEKLDSDYRPNGIARLGSVVIDVTATTFTSRFVDLNGDILDTFVIKK